MTSALRACMAFQVLSATTATPDEICTTCFTPGMALVFAASKLATLPPNTGQRATTAYSMLGRRTSMPNVALPLTLSGVSRRLRGLPMMLNWLGSFSATPVGGGSLAAASASSP